MPKWLEHDNLTQSPQALKHIKIMRFLLLFFGGWPDEQFGSPLPFLVNFQKVTMPYQISFFCMGSFYYLIKNFSNMNFFVFGHIVIVTAVCIVMIARTAIVNFKGYGPAVKAFMDFHLHHHKHKGGHYMEVYNITHRVSHYFTMYQTCMAVIGVALFNATPLYNDYKLGAFSRSPPKNQSFDYSIFYTYPGFSQDNHFYLSTIVNIYCSSYCGVVICIFDLLLCLIVFQIIGHIKTLMLDFETLTKPERDVTKLTNAKLTQDEHLVMFSDEENKAVHGKLMEMVDHHRHIVSFTDTISTFFGPLLGLNYAFHLFSGCILLLECSSKDTKELARFGPLTANILGELVLLSVVFEFVGSMSEKLKDSVYSMPWESMNVRNQRSVLFLLARIQIPIQVTAMGCVPVGVKTMQGILKTTFSYYTMLMSLSGQK